MYLSRLFLSHWTSLFLIQVMLGCLVWLLIPSWETDKLSLFAWFSVESAMEYLNLRMQCQDGSTDQSFLQLCYIYTLSKTNHALTVLFKPCSDKLNWSLRAIQYLRFNMELRIDLIISSLFHCLLVCLT